MSRIFTTGSEMEQRQTRLQQDLQAQIIKLMHDQSLDAGARISELGLAKELGVSRSPIRAALTALQDAGFLEKLPGKGMTVIALPPVAEGRDIISFDDDDLLVRIAQDRNRNQLAEDVSEAELMERYKLSRQSVREALSQLADLDVIERKPGYGWRFVATFNDAAARAESYRFRMIIETAALLEPTFRIDPQWVQEMRKRHKAALASALSGSWKKSSSVAFFEMNAEFHAGLGKASGNRYIAQAITKQNQLRRFSNYDWRHGAERVVVNCQQHLEILDHLERGDAQIASMLIKRHLEAASMLKNTALQGS